jgi:hypothetical protein
VGSPSFLFQTVICVYVDFVYMYILLYVFVNIVQICRDAMKDYIDMHHRYFHSFIHLPNSIFWVACIDLVSPNTTGNTQTCFENLF